jgi:hypothetical protein
VTQLCSKEGGGVGKGQLTQAGSIKDKNGKHSHNNIA